MVVEPKDCLCVECPHVGEFAVTLMPEFIRLDPPFKTLIAFKGEWKPFFENAWLEVEHAKQIADRGGFIKTGTVSGPHVANTLKGEPIVACDGFWFIITGVYE